MLPETIRQQYLDRMEYYDVLKYRKLLLDYFKSIGSDRAKIEVFWQLTMLQDKSGVVDFLSSISKWKLIHTNSSLYFIGIDQILSKQHWGQIICCWKSELLKNPEHYSEKEIYTISDGLRTLYHIDDAASVLDILIHRNPDALSAASYYQQMASLYEDLGDERAVACIEQAVYFLETAGEDVLIQNKIDTYLAGANIYAFFLDKINCSETREKTMKGSLNKWLQNAVKLTAQANYANPNYLVYSYHNAAYVYWNIGQYEEALENINNALLISRPDETLVVSDLHLRAQIYNDIYCAENEYFSDEMGIRSVRSSASKDHFLELACKDLKEAMDRHEQLKGILENTTYLETLASLHYVMSQNCGYRGHYKEAIREVDIALDTQENAGIDLDLFIIYYQAAVVRLGAYNEYRKKRFLVETWDYLTRTQKSVEQCGTAEAYYYLNDIQKIRKYVFSEFKKIYENRRKTAIKKYNDGTPKCNPKVRCGENNLLH